MACLRTLVIKEFDEKERSDQQETDIVILMMMLLKIVTDIFIRKKVQLKTLFPDTVASE